MDFIEDEGSIDFSCVQYDESVGVHLLKIPFHLETQNYDLNKLESILQAMKEEYDFILFDAPPVEENLETITVSSLFDGVIFIVEASRSRWEIAESSINKLKQAGANVIAGIMNRRRLYIPQKIYNLI